MTKNQEKLLKFISNYRMKNNDYPTLKEMVDGIKVYDNRSALGIIDNLIKQGYLGKSDRKYRTVFLTDKSLELLKIGLFPISHEDPLFKKTTSFETGNVIDENNVSFSGHTPDIISSNKTIKSNGTNLDTRSIKNIIMSFVNIALSNYANGTFAGKKDKEKVANKITMLFIETLGGTDFPEKLSWAAILIILSTFCFLFFGKDLNSIFYSIVFTFTIFIIFKLSK